MTAPSGSYVGRLLAALAALFNGLPASDRARIHLASRDGFGVEAHEVTIAQLVSGKLPVIAFERLAAGWELRLSPAQLGPWPFLTLRCPIVGRFVGRRWSIDADAASRSKAALALLPPATVTIDAGPEIIGAWRLATPMRDARTTRAAVQAVARRVGSLVDEQADAYRLPLAGCIRGDWADGLIQILDVDPRRVYNIAALTTIQQPTGDTPHVHDHDRPVRVRRGARSGAAASARR